MLENLSSSQSSVHIVDSLSFFSNNFSIEYIKKAEGAIRDCCGFSHSLHQSDKTLNTITPWSFAFSSTSSSLLVSNLSSHWLIIMLPFVLIGYWDNLDFGFLDTQTNTALTNELLRINCLPKATYFLNRILGYHKYTTTRLERFF